MSNAHDPVPTTGVPAGCVCLPTPDWLSSAYPSVSIAWVDRSDTVVLRGNLNDLGMIARSLGFRYYQDRRIWENRLALHSSNWRRLGLSLKERLSNVSNKMDQK